jgi:energy-coupling factor transporter ATP-binding protein EcfA2
MDTPYAAHGLRLASSFELPGMQEAGDRAMGLPRLSLALQEPAELNRTWRASVGPPLWRGRQGDGYDLVIEQGVSGDLLFTYGDHARFRLAPDMERLDCAPNRPGPDWQRILLGKVVPSVSVMRGYEALHSAVIDYPDGVVAIMGPSGSGKSTLAAEMLSRGCSLFADDQLTLDQPDGTVRAHCGTPHMNLAEELPGELDAEALGTTLSRIAGERWLVANSTTPSLFRPVRLLCLLERGAGLNLEAHSLPLNPLLLAPYMLGLSIDAERQRSRFCLYADLMESATLVRVTAGLEHRPEQLADSIGQVLQSTREMTTENIS